MLLHLDLETNTSIFNNDFINSNNGNFPDNNAANNLFDKVTNNPNFSVRDIAMLIITIIYSLRNGIDLKIREQENFLLQSFHLIVS